MASGPPADSAASPGAAGYRWPAEWEPHAATWLSWPKNPETWPRAQLVDVEAAFVQMVAALAPRERVRINVDDEVAEARVRGLLTRAGIECETAPGVEFFRHPTNDAWVRDHGPIFLVGGPAEAPRAVLDCGFDAWGGKYPPWDADDAIPGRIARALGLPLFDAGLVLEGGSIEGDGAGSIITTESCLLAANRGPGGVPRPRDWLEQRLCALLGARRVLWLGDGIEGDDTDGHVDDLTRYLTPSRVVTVVEDDAGDANHAALAANYERLRGMSDGRGRPLEIVTLPMPPPIFQSGTRLPASYANFYLANGVLLLPTFGCPSDARAEAILRECAEGREIVGIPARDLVAGLGAVHCLTQQEPAPPDGV